MPDFGNVKSDNGIAKVNDHMARHSYVNGVVPTNEDVEVFIKMTGCPTSSKFPHAARWYKHIASYSETERSVFPGQKKQAKKDDNDDDFDLFGEETAEDKAAKDKLAAKAKEAAAGKKKKQVIEKSQLVIDVKPASPDISLDDLEKQIRNIKMEGLEWSITCKRLPIAFGLMKIQIGCNIVDSLIATDDVLANLESIGMTEDQKKEFLKRREAGEDEDEDDDDETSRLVQSAEIVSFNKL